MIYTSSLNVDYFLKNDRMCAPRVSRGNTFLKNMHHLNQSCNLNIMLQNLACNLNVMFRYVHPDDEVLRNIRSLNVDYFLKND